MPSQDWIDDTIIKILTKFNVNLMQSKNRGSFFYPNKFVINSANDTIAFEDLLSHTYLRVTFFNSSDSILNVVTYSFHSYSVNYDIARAVVNQYNKNVSNIITSNTPPSPPKDWMYETMVNILAKFGINDVVASGYTSRSSLLMPHCFDHWTIDLNDDKIDFEDNSLCDLRVIFFDKYNKSMSGHTRTYSLNDYKSGLDIALDVLTFYNTIISCSHNNSSSPCGNCNGSNSSGCNCNNIKPQKTFRLYCTGCNTLYPGDYNSLPPTMCSCGTTCDPRPVCDNLFCAQLRSNNPHQVKYCASYSDFRICCTHQDSGLNNNQSNSGSPSFVVSSPHVTYNAPLNDWATDVIEVFLKTFGIDTGGHIRGYLFSPKKWALYLGTHNVDTVEFVQDTSTGDLTINFVTDGKILPSVSFTKTYYSANGPIAISNLLNEYYKKSSINLNNNTVSASSSLTKDECNYNHAKSLTRQEVLAEFLKVSSKVIQSTSYDGLYLYEMTLFISVTKEYYFVRSTDWYRSSEIGLPCKSKLYDYKASDRNDYQIFRLEIKDIKEIKL